jgi:hypothetical protein
MNTFLSIIVFYLSQSKAPLFHTYKKPMKKTATKAKIARNPSTPNSLKFTA